MMILRDVPLWNVLQDYLSKEDDIWMTIQLSKDTNFTNLMDFIHTIKEREYSWIFDGNTPQTFCIIVSFFSQPKTFHLVHSGILTLRKMFLHLSFPRFDILRWRKNKHTVFSFHHLIFFAYFPWNSITGNW